MTTRKVSVTLEADGIEQARNLVGPRGLSAYVDAALQEKLERDLRRTALLSYLDELDAADPPTASEHSRGSQRAASILREIDD